MKNIFSEEFKRNCYLDICEIFSFVDEFMPELEDWQMKNSVFIDDNKRITYKTLLRFDGTFDGYEANIEVYLDKLYRYNLVVKENMLDLSINYTEDNKQCKERYKTSSYNNIPRRLCSYRKGMNSFKYSDSDFSESLYCINSKFKKMETGNDKNFSRFLKK